MTLIKKDVHMANSVKLSAGTNSLKLESCAMDGCNNKSHDMCQGQYAFSKKLKERDGQAQKKICFHQLSSYYHTDSSNSQPPESPAKHQEMALDSEKIDQ